MKLFKQIWFLLVTLFFHPSAAIVINIPSEEDDALAAPKEKLSRKEYNQIFLQAVDDGERSFIKSMLDRHPEAISIQSIKLALGVTAERGCILIFTMLLNNQHIQDLIVNESATNNIFLDVLDKGIPKSVLTLIKYPFISNTINRVTLNNHLAKLAERNLQDVLEILCRKENLIKLIDQKGIHALVTAARKYRRADMLYFIFNNDDAIELRLLAESHQASPKRVVLNLRSKRNSRKANALSWCSDEPAK